MRSSGSGATSVVLLSLHPRFAELIYQRAKQWEIRRVHVSLKPGDMALIYETSPVCQVTGAFSVSRVLHGPPQEIARLIEDPSHRLDVRTYLNGARSASAIGIGNARRWRRPRSLSRFGIPRAPQSYVFVRRRH